MALFTARDRIAIAVICTLILAGWGVRLMLDRDRSGDIRLIRGAVPVPPAAVGKPDSVLPVPAAPALSTAPAAIDINRAAAAELENLPGIGPVKAAAIIEHRTRNGPFRTPADIVKVTGIGPKTYERIAPLITAGGGVK